MSAIFMKWDGQFEMVDWSEVWSSTDVESIKFLTLRYA